MQPYPIVSFQNITDIFHSILFWKFQQKPENTRRLQKGSWSFAFRVMFELRIIPKERVVKIQQSKERAKEFLKRTHIIQQWDGNGFYEIPSNPRILFALRITEKEMVLGRNTPEPRELFTRTPVFLTRRGVVVADIAIKAVSHLITEEAFLAKSTEITDRFYGLSSLAGASLAKKYHSELNKKIWGEKKDDEDGE